MSRKIVPITLKTLLDGLKVSEDKEICEKHMGKYPVICVSLKNVDTFILL
jgi:hypothetical protein